MSYVIYEVESTRYLCRPAKKGNAREYYETERSAKGALTRTCKLNPDLDPDTFRICPAPMFNVIEKKEVRKGIVHAEGKEFTVGVNTPWTSGPWAETYHCRKRHYMQDPNNPKRWLTSQEIRDFRARLFHEQNGLCHWCQCPMELVRSTPDNQNVGNIATFEHLKDRLSPGGRQSSADTIVAACSDCNNARNREREKLVQDAIHKYCNGDALLKQKLCHGKPMARLIEMLSDLGLNPLKD